MNENYRVILQTILLPSSKLCNEEEVYFHRKASDIVDYDGYFNLFYVEKHKRYTNISKLLLVLRIKGVKKITLMHNREELSSCLIEDTGVEKSYELKFPYDEYQEGVFWFRVQESDAGSSQISGSYQGTTQNINHVKVFVDICTYKRELYVLRNMRTVVDFLKNPLHQNIRENISIALIDNGQTLQDYGELQELISNNQVIRVIKNRNTGGAGGFTRGMEEAIALKEKDNLTHILIMDDDAAFDTDLFVRLYGILRTLKDEYKDLTIGGAMWREDYPFIQHASGEWFENMRVKTFAPLIDLRSYEECTQEEMCTTQHEYERYSAWWCCCYSLNVVRLDNLPIQFFVHLDDVEYGFRNRRNGNPIAFFNGIGVWHKGFENEYAGFKAYYDVRNTLIATTLFEKELTKKDIQIAVRKKLTGLCLNRRYFEMNMAYMGAMDFLKGYDWFRELDIEEHHKKIYAYTKENLVFQDLSELSIANKEDIERKISEYGRGIKFENLMQYKKPLPRKNILLKKLTLNGQLLPAKKGAAFITPATGLWEDDFRYRETVFYQPTNGKVLYRRTDLNHFFEVVKMYSNFKKELSKSDVFSYRTFWKN